MYYFRMAEPIDISSKFESANPNGLFDCDPCFKAGIVAQAVGYCSVCLEFYCEHCLGTHQRSALTESHNIRQGTDMPPCRLDKKLKYSPCRQHDEEPKVLFCKDHDQLICYTCVDTGHKKCSVMQVSKACSAFAPNYDKPPFRKAISKLNKTTQKLKRSTTDQMALLDTQLEKNSNDGRAFREKAMAELNRSYAAFEAELVKIYNHRKDMLLKEKVAVENLESELDSISKTIQQRNMKQDKEIERFLNWYADADNINQYKLKMREINTTKFDLECNFNLKLLSKSKFCDVSLQRQKSGCVIS